jgi:hypothetical protein
MPFEEAGREEREETEEIKEKIKKG